MKGNNRRLRSNGARRSVGLGGALMLLVGLTGCTVTLLSAYDPGTDQMTTALQRSVADHIEALAVEEAPACLYENYRAFYRQQHVDVGALELRVNAIDRNQPTIVQVSELKSALSRFELLHQAASDRKRCQSPAELQPAASGLNSTFGAILKLEIAKQRGGKTAT